VSPSRHAHTTHGCVRRARFIAEATKDGMVAVGPKVGDVGGPAPAVRAVPRVKSRQVQFRHDIEDEPRQVPFRKPVRHGRRHQHQLLSAVPGHEVVSHTTILEPTRPNPPPPRRRFARQPRSFNFLREGTRPPAADDQGLHSRPGAGGACARVDL